MNDSPHLKAWFQLPDDTKLNVYTETGRKLGLPAVAIEKDWWVVHTLSLIFSMECAPSLIFKGGTSLSKGWNLIERFSEDIDLALDREYLGFKGELEKADIRRLRRKSFEYLTTVFLEELKTKFKEAGFADVGIKYREVVNHDQDPIIIEIYYPKLTETDTYLKPGVLVEVGSRSLVEPNTDRTFATMVAENFATQPFVDTPVTIPIVNPERTFLEKIFLLHEEFQKQGDKIRVDRLSRHLYDIEKLSQTQFAVIALQDGELYNTIVEHRSRFSPISGIDFANHQPGKIAFIPPAHLLADWEADYKQMRENMIYGETWPFVELIAKLTHLQTQINGKETAQKTEIRREFQIVEFGYYPSDWKVKEIGKIISSIQLGGNYPNTDIESEFLLIKMGNLNRGYIDLKKKYFLKQGVKPLDIDKLKFGDVLFNTRNTLDLVGKVAIWRNEESLAFFNSNIMRIEFDKDEISSNEFMSFMLNTPNALHKLREIAKGTTSVAAIYPKDFFKITVLYPTKAEQTAIATALNDADALITQLEKFIAKKKAIKQGAMQELLKPKKEWEEKQFGEVIKLQGGSQPPLTTFISTEREGYIRLLQIRDYKTDTYLTFIPILLAKKFCKKDDIMIGRYGPPVFQILKGLEGAYNVALMKAVPLPSITKSYAYHFLKQDSLLFFVEKLSQRTAGQSGIDIKELNNYPFHVPPIKEQNRITNILSDMDSEIEILESKLEKQKMLKQGMMQQLLTGKIRLAGYGSN